MAIFERLLNIVAEAAGAAPGRAETANPAQSERLTVASILVHVARVDGDLSDRERRRVEAAIEARFGLNSAEARRLVSLAERLEEETGDVACLLNMAERDATERRRLVGMAYSVAAADGAANEFEEALVWRLGRLLGFDDREIEAIKETQAIKTI